MYIGKRVKELREKQNMKLIELAEKSGVQLATLSRIEHLRMTGTLESHMMIAKALGVDITELYRSIVTPEEKHELNNPQPLSDIFIHSDKSSYEILTNKLMSKRMMPMLFKIEPDGKSQKEQNKYGTEKFVYVLSGKLDVHINNKVHTIGKNSSLYFDATQEHYFANTTEQPLKFLCVVTPVAL